MGSSISTAILKKAGIAQSDAYVEDRYDRDERLKRYAHCNARGSTLYFLLLCKHVFPIDKNVGLMIAKMLWASRYELESHEIPDVAVIHLYVWRCPVMDPKLKL